MLAKYRANITVVQTTDINMNEMIRARLIVQAFDEIESLGRTQDKGVWKIVDVCEFDHNQVSQVLPSFLDEERMSRMNTLTVRATGGDLIVEFSPQDVMVHNARLRFMYTTIASAIRVETKRYKAQIEAEREATK